MPQEEGGGQARGVWVPLCLCASCEDTNQQESLEKDQLQRDFSTTPQHITQSPSPCWCDYSIQLVKYKEWHFALGIWKSSA